MSSHRRKTRPTRRIYAAVILVAMAGLTVRAVEQLEDPAVEVVADTTGTSVDGPIPSTTSAQATVSRPGKSRSARQSAQTPSADTIPKSVCQPKRVAETITVLTYNIRYAQDGLAHVLHAIRAADADVVLLQEVDRFRARSRDVDMPTYLSRRLGMSAAFGANVAGGRSQHGTAILSRFPIEEEWNALLPNRRGLEQRGLLHVVLNVEGLRLSVYGTHLDPRDEQVQLKQISAIKNVVVEDPMPTVLGGDFGSQQPGSPVLQIALSVLDDAWAAGVGVGSPSTSPAARPQARIGYLLHRGVALEPMLADVRGTDASDHRAVRTAYRLRGNAGSVCHDQPLTRQSR